MVTLRATFDGKVLVPEEPVDLPTGRLLHVQVSEAEAPRAPDSDAAAAARAALASLEPIPAEDAAEFERCLAEAQVPADDVGPFDGDDHDHDDPTTGGRE